jgi:hypothetical protein
LKKWDVFISHASKDKQTVALPLAEGLIRAGLKVWLDQFELRIGDSLRERIDEGLSESTFGVVVLSKHFLNKPWPKKELNGLFALEEEGVKVILPVWHGVSAEDVKKFSPILADRVGISTAIGISALTKEIFHVIKGNREAVGGHRQSKVDGLHIAKELEALPTGRRHTGKFYVLIKRAFEYLFLPELTHERGPTEGRFVYRLVPMSEGWLHVHSRYGTDYIFVLMVNGEPTSTDLQKFCDFLFSRSCRFGVITCSVFPKYRAEVLRRRKNELRERGTLIFFLGPEFLRQLLCMTSRVGRDNSFFKRLKKVELDILHGR